MFLQNMFTAAEQVVILYAIALVGFIADKLKLYTKETAKKCTDLLFYIITPAKLIESFLTLEYSRETLKGFFAAFGCGMLMHGLAAACISLFYRKSSPEKASVYRFASIYGNCGFMGLPLIDAVVGSEGVFYCSVVIASFQIFTFTHGVYIMNKGKSDGKAKIKYKNLILNPGVIAAIIGLPLFILSVKLPAVVTTPVSYIASMNSPLAMLIFGTYVANTDFRAAFNDPKIITTALFKLIAMPAVMIALLKAFGINGMLGLTIIICAAAPSANNTVIFSAKYDSDTELASRLVAIISLVSIVTLPLIIAAANTII